MSREATIPLLLWIPAAVLLHLGGGGGAVEVAQTLKDRADLRAMVQGVQHDLRPSEQTIEVTFATPRPSASTSAVDRTSKPDPSAAPRVDPPKDQAKPKPKPRSVAARPLPLERKAKPTPTPVDPRKKPPEAKPPEPKKPDPPKPPPLAPLASAPPPPPPPPMAPLPPPDRRIAIQQHAPKSEEDNPTAQRIADEAAHVVEETMARLRTHDQDSPDPSVGKAHAGPDPEPGNADHDKVADSEDHAGDASHAPGEAAVRSTSATHASAGSVQPAHSDPVAASGQREGSGQTAAPPAPAGPPPSEGGAGPASPEAVAAEGGVWSLDPANPGGDGRTKNPGRAAPPSPFQSPVDVSQGIPGVAHLGMQDVVAAVGDKQLKAEREADGEARKSAHRGSFAGDKFGQYRGAIENYDPSVKLGNQTALNAARVPFASFLNTVHNRIHPIFAEEFLDAAGRTRDSVGLNDMALATHVEIVLSKDEGRIVRMGITRASGVTAFDIAALNAVSRASPFGKAPDAIVSPDGNVYLHWEFHRDPYDACSTRFARPYMIKEPAAAPRPAAPPRRPLSPKDEQQGPLVPLRDP